MSWQRRVPKYAKNRFLLLCSGYWSEWVVGLFQKRPYNILSPLPILCILCDLRTMCSTAAGRNEGHVALDVVDLPALNFYGRKWARRECQVITYDGRKIVEAGKVVQGRAKVWIPGSRNMRRKSTQKYENANFSPHIHRTCESYFIPSLCFGQWK